MRAILVLTLILITLGLSLAKRKKVISSKAVQVAANIAQIVALVATVLSLVVPIGNEGAPPTQRPTSIATVEAFAYQIRVQDKASGQGLPNAKVVIDAEGIASLVGLTDSNGFARVFVERPYIGRPGRIAIELAGYEPYRQEIDIRSEKLPALIQLLPAASPPTVIPLTSDTARVLYEADFSFWRNESYKCVEYEYVPSENARHTRVRCLHAAGTSTPSTKLLDFDLHITAQKVSGSDRAWYGAVLHSSEGGKETEHRFFISGIGNYTYEIAEYNQAGEQTSLSIVIPHAYSPAIRTKDGLNSIQLKRRRGAIEFRVNGETVFIKETSLPATGEVTAGLAVITQNEDYGGDDFVDVAFKLFKAYEAK